jgi:hypothetical protein
VKMEKNTSVIAPRNATQPQMRCVRMRSNLSDEDSGSPLSAHGRRHNRADPFVTRVNGCGDLGQRRPAPDACAPARRVHARFG